MAETTPSKYDSERSGLTKLDAIRAEQDAAIKKEGDYSPKFTDDYDKIKADTNNDGKVDENEYKKYVVEKIEKKPTIASIGTVNEDVKNNHNYYHFDSILLVSVGIICVTLIICTFLKYRN